MGIYTKMKTLNEIMKIEGNELFNDKDLDMQSIEISNDCFNILDFYGNLLFMSKSVQKLMEIEVISPFLNKSWLDFWESTDRLSAENAIKEAQNGVVSKFQGLSPTIKDATKWWDISIIPIKDIYGHIRYLLAILKDIPDRKIMEDELRKSEDFYRDIFENSNDLICTHDLEGNLTMLNRTSERYTGYTINELLKMKLQDLIVPEYKHLFKEYLSKIKNSGKDSGFMVILTKSGDKRYWQYNNSLRTEGVEKPIIRGIARDITEQKLSEIELKKSNAELQKFLDDDIAGYFLSTASGQLLQCNKTFLKLFGFKTKQDVQNYNIEHLYYNPSSRKDFLKLLKEKKKLELFNCEYITPKGKIIYTIENVIGIFNEDGELIKIRGYIFDISKKIEAFNEIWKLSNTVEQSPVSTVITNPSGDIEYVNQKYCEVTGYTREELLGKNQRILRSDYHDQKFYEELWHTILSGNVWEGEFKNIKKNGDIFWESAKIFPLINKNGDIINFIGLKEDITKEKQVDDEINMLANALRSVNECVYITDIYNNIIFVNDSLLKTYGYNEKELLGKNLQIFRSDMYPLMSNSEILLDTKQSGWQGEIINKRKDGTEFPIYLSTNCILDKDNNIAAFIGVATDITESKLKEKELIEAKELAEQSNKVKDGFIANMSHEIRTPLNGIVGMANLIKETFAENITEEDKVLFDGIESASKRLLRTFELILNFSRLQAGDIKAAKKEIDILKICTNLVKEFNLTIKDTKFLLTIDNYLNDTTIFADGYKIRESIANLIDNGIKYTKEGFVRLKLYKNNQNEILLDISDSGIGINENNLSKIFEPYFQEKMGMYRTYEGVGLGLSIAKNYLALNNFNICVESIEGKGTTFTINFGKNIK